MTTSFSFPLNTEEGTCSSISAAIIISLLAVCIICIAGNYHKCLLKNFWEVTGESYHFIEFGSITIPHRPNGGNNQV
ncbi:MAG: hypothetical protein WCC17_17195, partial [Candidatus Nitrosopolaris sp.]